MLPDYMPAVHPLLVHFPIVLLLVGVLADTVAALLPPKRRLTDQLRPFANGLLLLAAIALPLTYWSGRQAVDAIHSPFVEADRLAAEHADWAWWTLWFFLALITIRLAAAATDKLGRKLHVGLALAGLVGLGLLIETAEHGGRLVYDLGVGVRPVREAPEGAFDIDPPPDPDSLGPVRSTTGLRWRFQPGVETLLSSYFEVLAGTLPGASIESRETALLLEARAESESVIALDGEYADVNVRLAVNFDAFSGRFGILHHVSDDGYDFLIAEGGKLRLGRVSDGDGSILHEVEFAPTDGWHELELVGAGDHFRGYVDGELMVHGHAPAREPGRVGLLVEGNGSIRVDDLRVTPLEDSE